MGRINWVFNVVADNPNPMKGIDPKYLWKRAIPAIMFVVAFNLVWLIAFPLSPTIVGVSSKNAVFVCRPQSSMSLVMATLCVAFVVTLLVMNVFLAFKVRTVNSAFNESKQIGFAVYNMTLFVVILLPMSLSFKDTTLAFVLMSLAISVP